MSQEGGQPEGKGTESKPAPQNLTEEAEEPEPTPSSDELLEKLQYLQAEFENYRKRVEKEREEVVRLSNMVLVSKLLPTLDAFDNALASLQGEARDGLAMIHGGLVKTLEAAGLKEIPAQGAPFDPYLHDVGGFTDGSDQEDGRIAEVLQKGYTFQSKVVRPSRVIVARSGGEDE